MASLLALFELLALVLLQFGACHDENEKYEPKGLMSRALMNLRELGMTCDDERGSQKFEIPFEKDECASQYGAVGQRARYNLQHIALVEEYTYYVERVAHAEGVHHVRNARHVTQQRGDLLEQPVRQHVRRSEIENRVSQNSCRTPKVAGIDMGTEVCENGAPVGCEIKPEKFPRTSDCNIGAGCLRENGSKVVNETPKLLTAHGPNRDVSLPGVAAQYSLGGCDQFESERSEGAVSNEKWRHLLTPTGNYMEFNNINLRSNHFLNFNDLVPNMDILDFRYFGGAVYTEDINVKPYIDFDMDFNVVHFFVFNFGLNFFLTVFMALVKYMIEAAHYSVNFGVGFGIDYVMVVRRSSLLLEHYALMFVGSIAWNMSPSRTFVASLVEPYGLVARLSLKSLKAGFWKCQ
jgi:hypothetical protein